MGKLYRILAFLLFAVPVAAKDFYIAQKAAGNGSGLNGCTNASTPAWFNNSASWGTGALQIGPGTTVHLCGTFTGTPGQQLLTAKGNGTSTSPITIKFEAGAKLTAPYWAWSGAINAANRSYIVIDGGGSGLIQNTASGTNLTYKQDTRAIYAGSCFGCVVKNLTIANMYVHTSVSDTAVHQNAANCVHWLASDNFTIHNVTCHDAGWAFSGYGNNFTLEYSNVYNVDHGLAFGASGTNSNFSIHDNHIHGYVNWDTTTNAYHHDGLHIWGRNGGVVTNGVIYNNLFDGDSGVNITGHIYLQDSVKYVSVYNNVFIVPSTRYNNVLWFNGQTDSTPLPGGPATGNSAYNNFISAGMHTRGTAMYVNAQYNFSALNNVLMGGQSDITIQTGGTRSSAGIDHNIYLQLADYGDRNTFGYQSAVYQTLAQWQQACGCDAHSKIVSASQINTGSMGQPLSGSVLIGSASNLINFAKATLSTLANDKLGVARQLAGSWDVGAYRYQSTYVALKPASPGSVTATIQ